MWTKSNKISAHAQISTNELPPSFSSALFSVRSGDVINLPIYNKEKDVDKKQQDKVIQINRLNQIQNFLVDNYHTFLQQQYMCYFC